MDVPRGERSGGCMGRKPSLPERLCTLPSSSPSSPPPRSNARHRPVPMSIHCSDPACSLHGAAVAGSHGRHVRALGCMHAQQRQRKSQICNATHGRRRGGHGWCVGHRYPAPRGVPGASLLLLDHAGAGRQVAHDVGRPLPTQQQLNRRNQAEPTRLAPLKRTPLPQPARLTSARPARQGTVPIGWCRHLVGLFRVKQGSGL